MEMYELMVNRHTSKGTAQAKIKRSAAQCKCEKILLSHGPWLDWPVDVTTHENVMIIKSKILKDSRLSFDYVIRGTALFLDDICIFLTTVSE